MIRPFIMPLGFIDKITDDGAIFTLTKPGHPDGVGQGAPVTVWTYSPECLAIARIRGQVTASGYSKARFIIDGSDIDPRWPEGEDLLRIQAPVYLAMPGSFDPNPARMTSGEEEDTRHPGED